MRLYANGSTSSSSSSSTTIDPERESLLSPTDNSVVHIWQFLHQLENFIMFSFTFASCISCTRTPRLGLLIKCLLRSPIRARTSWWKLRLDSTIPTSTEERRPLVLSKLFAFRYYLIKQWNLNESGHMVTDITSVDLSNRAYWNSRCACSSRSLLTIPFYFGCHVISTLQVRNTF